MLMIAKLLKLQHQHKKRPKSYNSMKALRREREGDRGNSYHLLKKNQKEIIRLICIKAQEVTMV
jgi:hypothetical protein